MSEKVQKFVDDLSTGSNIEAGEAFKDALRDKVASALDQARIDVAGKIFNGVEVQPHSDPKPAVIDPSDKTDQIMDTEGEQIEFTPNTQTQPEAEVPEAPVEAPTENETK